MNLQIPLTLLIDIIYLFSSTTEDYELLNDQVMAVIPSHRNLILVKKKSKSHERRIIVRLDGKSRNIIKPKKKE